MSYAVVADLPPQGPPGTRARPATSLARADAQRLGIPLSVYDRYCEHLRASQKHGVAFAFNIEDWWRWWQVDGRWSRRGHCGGGVVMARIGGAGAFAPGNVHAASPASHLGARGVDAPRARPVMTPRGRFGTIKDAAAAHGVTKATVRRRIVRGKKGWRWGVVE